MTHKKTQGFDIVKRMVRDHLSDVEKSLDPVKPGVGPTPEQSYSAAYSTATGAYAGQGITVKQWAELQTEIRDHQAAFQGCK